MLDRKLAAGEDAIAFTSLTDAIMLSVDSNSASSVSHYRALLKNVDSEDERDNASDMEAEDEAEKPLDPLQQALKVALIDHAIAVKRGLNHYTRSAHQATKADLQQREYLYLVELEIIY